MRRPSCLRYRHCVLAHAGTPRYVAARACCEVAIDDSGEPGFLLTDGRGDEIPEVGAFLRTLAVRRFSPNTIRAYAYDLQKLLSFLYGRAWMLTKIWFNLII